MTREEAIDKLERIINSPVGREEIDETCYEVMKYLAAQKPVNPMRKHGKRGWFFYCPKCETILNDIAKPKYCSECGQGVKWHDQ